MTGGRLDTTKLNFRLESFQSRSPAPGIAAALIRGSADHWTGASGTADPVSGEPMTAAHNFALGSMTKSFVAALALRLAEQGRWSLEEPIARYLPPDVDSNGATVREVLAHRSGMPEHVTPRFVSALLSDRSRTWSAREALSFKEGSVGLRGEWAYASTNYLVLGLAIEQTVGRPVGAMVRSVVLQPLGLVGITYQDLECADGPLTVGVTTLIGSEPEPLLGSDGVLPCRSVATAAGAAGGMAGDAESVARWAHLLYGGRVLHRQSLSALIGTEDRGLGSMRIDVDGLEAFGHPGRIPGYRGLVAHVPAISTSCAVLMNTDATDAEPLDVMRVLLAELSEGE